MNGYSRGRPGPAFPKCDRAAAISWRRRSLFFLFPAGPRASRRRRWSAHLFGGQAVRSRRPFCEYDSRRRVPRRLVGEMAPSVRRKLRPSLPSSSVNWRPVHLGATPIGVLSTLPRRELKRWRSRSRVFRVAGASGATFSGELGAGSAPSMRFPRRFPTKRALPAFQRQGALGHWPAFCTTRAAKGADRALETRSVSEGKRRGTRGQNEGAPSKPEA